MKRIPTLVILMLCCLFAYSQNHKLVIEPPELTMEVGDKVNLNVYVQDAKGNRVDRRIRIFSRNGKAVNVDDKSNVMASMPGEHTIIILSPDPQGDRNKRLRVDYKVTVNYPALAEIYIDEIPNKIYAGTTITLNIKVYDKTGFHREDVKVTLSSTKNASVDAFYNVTGLKPGTATITARVDEIVNTVKVNIVDNPVAAMSLESDMQEASAGDVFHFSAKALDKKGKEVQDAPITYAFTGEAYDVSSSASGLISVSKKTALFL